MHDVRAVFLDFGGVIAEEGFKAGISEIAGVHGMDPEELKKIAFDLVYRIGFVTGTATASDFWLAFREASGIQWSDSRLTKTVLDRFVIRSYMLETARRLRETGIRMFVLSDQTHWLDEIDVSHPFFYLFETVFNSYYLGITKKDPGIFDLVLKTTEVCASQALFVDDHLPHIERARAKGMHTVFFTDKPLFLMRMTEFFPNIDWNDL